MSEPRLALADLLNQLEGIGIYIPGEAEGQWAGTEGLSFERAEAATNNDGEDELSPEQAFNGIRDVLHAHDEWSSGTLDEIAVIMEAAGVEFHDPNLVDVEESEGTLRD